MSEHFFFFWLFFIIDLVMVMVGGRQAPKDWCF